MWSEPASLIAVLSRLSRLLLCLAGALAQRDVHVRHIPRPPWGPYPREGPRLSAAPCNNRRVDQRRERNGQIEGLQGLQVLDCTVGGIATRD